jgi:hypothetical protein
MLISRFETERIKIKYTFFTIIIDIIKLHRFKT